MLYAHLVGTADVSNQLADTADAGGDDAAGRARAGNEWIGLALGQDHKVAGLIQPGHKDILLTVLKNTIRKIHRRLRSSMLNRDSGVGYWDVGVTCTPPIPLDRCSSI